MKIVLNMISFSSVKHKSRNSEKRAGHTSVNIVNENYDEKWSLTSFFPMNKRDEDETTIRSINDNYINMQFRWR